MKKPDPDQRLTVRVLSPTQTFYNGPATTVSAHNKVGPFDILVNHANFFSLLTAGDVTINTGQRRFSIPVSQGIIKVSNNKVTLFIDIEPVYLAKTQKSKQ